jgi:hypothetical protein
MTTLPGCPSRFWRIRRPIVAALLAISMSLLGGCDDEPKVTDEDRCDEGLDEGDWDQAIKYCKQIESDSGYSRTAQAYMGRAGISLLSLIEKLGETELEGLALVLGAFTVTPVQFLDVEKAIEYLLRIESLSETDSFNLIVASDVAIATVLQDSLGIEVDADTGELTISGITDAGLDTVDTSDPAAVQDALNAVYGATYYSTSPPVWDHPGSGVVDDLLSISSYIQANALGTAAVDLGELSSLDFATAIDSGQCGLSAGASQSSSADASEVAQFFPRRLNTSDPTSVQLADDLHYVLLDASGAVDDTREWQGSFILPSRLLNPDFVGVECGQAPAGVQLGEFSLCMAAGETEVADITSVTESDLTTAITCGGSCTTWPVLPDDDNAATDEQPANGATAMTELAAVLHQLYPVDNDDADPESSGLHCAAGDGWVHAREFDYYLRTFGQ